METHHPYYSDFSRFYVALDCIIFGFDGRELKVLIHKRPFDPLRGGWSLFGGFLKEEEGLQDAANRILYELTGLDHIYMEQLQTYGAIDRDPADRVISVAYYALIPVHKDMKALFEKNEVVWLGIHDLPELIMDHNRMVEMGLQQLRKKLATEPVAFELLPGEFTIPQLQALYEAIFRTRFDKRNFRKKMLSQEMLVRQEKKDKTHSRKGAFLYRFDKERYQQLIKKGKSFTYGYEKPE